MMPYTHLQSALIAVSTPQDLSLAPGITAVPAVLPRTDHPSTAPCRKPRARRPLRTGHHSPEDIMPSLRLPILALLLGVMVSACRQDATAPVRPDLEVSVTTMPSYVRAPRMQSVTLVRRPSPMSVRENELIDRIVMLNPREASTTLRSVLTNRFARLNLPSNPGAQSLLEELSATRAMPMLPAAEPVDATVVLVDRLAEPSASAIVVRRANMLPHDVILLPSDQATPAALRSGLTALFKLRRSAGDVPKSDSRVLVRGVALSRPLKPGLQASRANADLADLQRSAPRTIPGFGVARAIDVPLKSMDAERSRQHE